MVLTVDNRIFLSRLLTGVDCRCRNDAVWHVRNFAARNEVHGVADVPIKVNLDKGGVWPVNFCRPAGHGGGVNTTFLHQVHDSAKVMDEKAIWSWLAVASSMVTPATL